jgi:hypothetical protein
MHRIVAGFEDAGHLLLGHLHPAGGADEAGNVWPQVAAGEGIVMRDLLAVHAKQR